MRERGLDPEYSDSAHQQAMTTDGAAADQGLRDLRMLPWCSIDNGEGEEVSSRDLDQLSSASLVDGAITVRIAISDVDALVCRDCPADIQALRNTTTVYCASKTYPMIDPRFSENLTSLGPDEDRLAVVTEMRFGTDGDDLTDFSVYRAVVRSRAKLNYQATGDWLADRRGPPVALISQDDVRESLLLQDQVSQKFKQHRRAAGSLALESLEARAATRAGKVLAIRGQLRNRATELIENLMIACNGCTSRYLAAQHFPSLQRVVRKPKFWSRIVELASLTGSHLPEHPDSGCLQRFLEKRRADDPVTFPDLCLSVLKLLGRGEYVVERPGQPAIGHFGLAVREYNHSTAPNRRYPDLITQRLVKACLGGQPCPYSYLELEQLAKHCNQQESNAKKVERQTEKSAAALMLAGRIGQVFQVVVSGVNQSATWVRMLKMPVEGMFHGHARLGDQLTVKLVQTDVAKGFIDFAPVGVRGEDGPPVRRPLGGYPAPRHQNGKVH
jgi:exoribonuclease-2